MSEGGFIEVEEVTYWTVTCMRCRVRFKAPTQAKAEQLVRKHLRDAHNNGRRQP